MFYDDPTTVARLVGFAVPLGVALVAKKVASPGLKGVLNAALSAVAGSIAYLVTEDNAYDFEGFVNSVVNTFVVSISAYYGLLKPAGVTGAVADATANIGIGSGSVKVDLAERVDLIQNKLTELDEKKADRAVKGPSGKFVSRSTTPEV